MKSQAILVLFLGTALVSCAKTNSSHDSKPTEAELNELSVATFASGCFWCVEAVYESVNGVHEAVSGYSGGTTPNPTYQMVGAGRTDHAESVQVYYDSSVVSFRQLVDVYFGSQNPTQVNGQGPDHGPQYRSIIFFRTDQERQIAESARAELDASGLYDRPAAAEIVAFSKFWEAEEYHQDYERRNPDNPYVQSVSIPRLNRFKARFPELLEDQGVSGK